MVQFLFQAITPLAVHSTLKNEQGISGQRKVSGLDGPNTYSGYWSASDSTLSVTRILGRREYSAAVTRHFNVLTMDVAPNIEGMVIRTWSFPLSRQI